MSWERFNDQFRETDGERQERWKAIRAKRKAEGKCWQCAKPIVECSCPNVKSSPLSRPSEAPQAPTTEDIHQTIYRRVYNAVKHILGEQHLTGTIWLATEQAAEDVAALVSRPDQS